ncbi:Teichoic acid translocation permease protein TagG [Phycisphaerales bacterium]|nr:Teichoic acid translocation permease protein TagG [Phycisphaerales bacterium]
MHDAVLHSARPTPIPALLSPTRLASNLWRHRDLIGQFAMRFFHLRHRGTHLGVVWALVLPLLMMVVYTAVFNFILSARYSLTGEETPSQFAVHLFCGLTVFTVFSESLVRSCVLVMENPAYVKKVVFPVEILPVSQLFAALMFSGIGLVLTIIGTVVFFGRIPWTVVLIPLVMLPMVAMTLGLSWFLASLGVFLRDITNIITILVSQVLIFVTPVFYSLERLPEPWREIASFNPLAPIVDGARKVIVMGEQPDWTALGAVLVVGLACMQMGYAWFMKSKRGFADVL